MGFLPPNKQPELVDQALCQDLWTMLQGEKNKGVSIDTLRVALLNIIGIRLPERVKVPEGEETN